MCLLPLERALEKRLSIISKASDKKNPKENVVKEEKDEDSILTVSLFVIHANEWILDSNCSYHMCPNKD